MNEHEATFESTRNHNADFRDKKSHQHRKRGFTYVPHLWAMSSNQPGYERKEIEFNKHEKPIGPNKSDFIEFLGSIDIKRKLAPLKYLKWTDVPDDDKNAILVHVKGIFVVPPGYNERILQVVGKSSKTFTARIKEIYYNIKLTMEQNLRNRPDTHDVKGRDERVDEEHWKVLVKHWSTDKAQAISEQNKKIEHRKNAAHYWQKEFA